MEENYFQIIKTECSKYLSKEQYNKIFKSMNIFNNSVLFLDCINISIYDLKINNEISECCYEKILNILDSYYQKGNFYSVNRIDWLNELRFHEGKIQLEEHHKNLLTYFNSLNEILNDNKIDYFHASGFLCCLLVGRPLERYHHDIDLYVNIEDIDKIKNIFNNSEFELIHTCEKNDKNIFRHGYKIESSIYNIPIWLSFYKRLTDGTIYMQEYYQNINGTCFTKQNYNSPYCCQLSLIKHSYNNIPFTSLSLEALYVSKLDNRKKDIFDCNIIKNFVNRNNIEKLHEQLCNIWDKIEGLPKEMEEAFFNLEKGDNNNAKTLTKK